MNNQIVLSIIFIPVFIFFAVYYWKQSKKHPYDFCGIVCAVMCGFLAGIAALHAIELGAALQ